MMSNDEVSKDQKDISNEIKNFKPLYAKKWDEFQFTAGSGIFIVEEFSQLRKDWQQLYKELLAINQCLKVLLNTCQINKSPCKNGITTQFYQAFWHLFGKTLVGSLNKGYQIGELSIWQKQDIITILVRNRQEKEKQLSHTIRECNNVSQFKKAYLTNTTQNHSLLNSEPAVE